MDFETKIAEIEWKIDAATRDLRLIKSEFVNAKIFTAKFLAECQAHKIKKVGISRILDKDSWPFGASGNVFTMGNATYDGWPAIWGVCNKLGIANGCGNTDQHNADTSQLIDGIYELKNGKWTRS